MGKLSFAQAAAGPAPTAGKKGDAFPDKFLWGCATAAHQVEGNNTNSDFWTMEHLSRSMFKEPSGDACDHYHLYPQDISMLADLGFNTYRFSIEWARIEPEEGFFSNAELDHYRRMLATCQEHHLTTMLTYYHFSLPRWFAVKGGWHQPKAADSYARYCEKVTTHLGDLVGYASTMNEPDVPQLLNWFNLPGAPAGTSIADMMQTTLYSVRVQLHAPEFSDLFLGDGKKTRDGLLAAHAKGKEAMKSVRPDMPVGFNLAMTDDQPAPEDSHLEEKQADVYAPWLEAARQCDYLGVQT
jgi:beta-glucosidase